MPEHLQELALDIDLQGGVVPISKAASALAALIKRARDGQQPIIVTQKGYPTGVLLPVDLYVALRARAESATAGQQAHEAVVSPPEASDRAADAPPGDQPAHERDAKAASTPKSRRGGRRKPADKA